MHPATQEGPSPAIGHLEEREGHTTGGSNPNLAQRIKVAASSLATKLHIPGTGHPSAHPTGGGGPVFAAVEHHRVTAQHVAPETPTKRPQWQVEKPQYHLQQQNPQDQEMQQQPHYGMPPSPATPLRETEKETPGTTVSNFPPSSAPQPEDPYQDPGSPTIPTPFSGIESPARLSSDTDELKSTYIKPLPSLDRSTESQEVYVEDLDTLVDEKGRAVGVRRSDGGKNAAQRLMHTGSALQEIEEEEEHTHAGPSPMYSTYAKTPRQETGKTMEQGMALAGSEMSPKEHESRFSEAAGTSAIGENNNGKEEIYATVEAEKQLKKEEDEEDQKIAATRRRAEIEEAEGRGHPKAMTHPLESPSGKIVIPALEIPDTIAVPRRGGTCRAILQDIQRWVFDNPILLFLLIAGTAGSTRAAWVFFSSSSSTFKEFGPLLLVSGAVALLASALATYTMTGIPSIVPLPERGLDAPDTPSTTGGGGGGGGGESLDSKFSPEEQPGPSEPISKESTRDLVQHPETADPTSQTRTAAGQKKGEGVLQKVEHAVGSAATAAKKGVLGALDPGQEMVGEVILETDTGEKVLLPDTEGPVHRAEDAVVHAAEKIKNVVVGVESKKTSSGAGAASGGGGGGGMGGYSSDSDVPGPVIEGVHPKTKGQGHRLAT